MATKIMKIKHGTNILSKLLFPGYLTHKTNLTQFFRSANYLKNDLKINSSCSFSWCWELQAMLKQQVQRRGLSKLQAQGELILRLNGEERNILMTALQEYQSKLIKDEYRRWRSKFGRPSKLPRLGDVDPTGAYCPFPEDWLQKKFVGIANSIPFIGFWILR
ncbi:hypothetical protein NQ318_019076 [Aromia moschata]|uniref:Uncharacterized protein n=1 Tax=Aromia moschata TaxID=1265417 RepID=A0AAV8Y7N5_9CUCU|nr:hypothetical protein NQ318_019076 [Aromia moschata]